MSAQPEQEPATQPAPNRRLQRWPGALALMALLVLFFIGSATWLLGTQSGLRFAIARARALTHGNLNVQQASGRLWGSLDLRGIQWRGTGGLDVRVASAVIDFDPLSLLHGLLDIRMVKVSGLRLNLPARKATASAHSSFHAPLDIHIAEGVLQRGIILRKGKTAITLDQLRLQGTAWTGSRLIVGACELQTPRLSVLAHGTVGLDGGWPGDAGADVEFHQGSRSLTLRMQGQSDGQTATVAATVNAPLAARLEVHIATHGPYPWIGSLTAPRLALAALVPGNGHTLALNLHGRGDELRAAIDGSLTIDAWPLAVQARLARGRDRTVRLDALDVTSPAFPGRLDARGHLALTPRLSTVMDLQWHDIQPPANLLPDATSSSGQARLAGSADGYRIQSKFSVRTSARPTAQARVTLALQGNRRTLHIESLDCREPHGKLQLTGRVTLATPRSWRIAAHAEHFDPSLIAPAWPGHLDFALVSTGELSRSGGSGMLRLRGLMGTLRSRPIRGKANLSLQGQRIPQGTLVLHSGGGALRYLGAPDKAWLRVEVSTLRDWLPQASGSIQASMVARGVWPNLNLDGRVQVRHLHVSSVQLDQGMLRTRVRGVNELAGTVHVVAQGLRIGAHEVAALDASLVGRPQALTLRAEARSRMGHASLAATASRTQTSNWSGVLRHLQVDSPRVGAWALRAPVAWTYRAGAATMTDACLEHATATVCGGGSRAADGSGRVDYRINRLPLAVLGSLAGLPAGMHVQGALDGSGRISFDAAMHLQGQATLNSPTGSIIFSGLDEQPVGWRDLRAQARIEATNGRFDAQARLVPAGMLDAHAAFGGTTQALTGQVHLVIPQLHMIEPFVPQLARIAGTLGADATLAGTLRDPVLDGRASVHGFDAELPALGLHLEHGDVTVARAADGAVSIDGSVRSGTGALTITGTGTAGDFLLALRGKDVLAADVPAAHVLVSPDLRFRRNAAGYALGGSVAIGRARVNLERLPGAGAAKPSPDVVIVNAPPRPRPKPLPLHADVLVNLGSAVQLRGFGLDGAVSGQLRVDESPGLAAIGRGEIHVAGTYRAYGQNLTIKQGRLLFAGTPLANPGLDITAERILTDITAGLHVGGTAQQPVLQVFSTPAMEQSEALSYLVTGKPLSSLKGSQGNMLGSAAQALGSAGGNLLAREIGARIGVEASVSANTNLGGAALTVGKYLSPRLYVGYGVGLFTPEQIVTLRYKLSRLLDLEAQSSALYNRFSLKYRVER